MHPILVHIFVTLTIVSGLASGTRTLITCAEVNNSSWTIENLKNVQLNDWPWVCLDSRYLNNASFDDAFSKLNISLSEAAGRGYIGFVQYYAEKKNEDLTARNADGNTPLHLAVLNKHQEVIRYIARKIPNHRELNKHNYEYNTPVMIAAKTCQTDIVQFFFKAMNLITYFSDSDKSDLLNSTIIGGCYHVLDYLIADVGFRLDEKDVHYLFLAAKGGSAAVLKHLIYEEGLVKEGVDREGNTALHVAALHGKLDAVEFFVHNLKYNPDVKNGQGETPSHFAAKGGSLPVLEYLIDDKRADLQATNSKQEKLLHYAAEYGHLPIVQYLVDRKGVDVDERDGFFLVTPVRKAIRANKFPVVRYLADEKHADLKLEDEYQRTAVHEAAQSGNVDLMKYLLDDKKLINELNTVDSMKKTPVRDTAEFGHLDLLKYLVDERHANISGVDNLGENILHTAIRFNRLPVVKYLIEEKGFHASDKTSSGKPVTKLTKDRKVLEYLRAKMTEESPKS